MSTTFELSPDASTVVSRLSRVAVPTDADSDALAHARDVATQLAAEHGWQLVLYDRSKETWMDHPHPRACVTADELDGEEWEHLVEQLRAVAAAGVDATAWLATVPSLAAIVDVALEVGIDGVVLPADLDKPKLIDRLLEGADPAERAERVAHLQLGEDAPVFLEVDDAGRVEVRAYDPAG